MPESSSPTNLSFEDAVEQLETLIEQIESGEVGLEEALQRYEDGAKLIQHCRSVLGRAEKRIAELTIEPGGELSISDDQSSSEAPEED